MHTHIEINRCFCWNWNGFIHIYANQPSCKYACYDLGYLYLLLLFSWPLFPYSGFTWLLTHFALFFSDFYSLNFSQLCSLSIDRKRERERKTERKFQCQPFCFLWMMIGIFYYFSLSFKLVLSLPSSSLLLFHFICNKSINRRYRFVGI